MIPILKLDSGYRLLVFNRKYSKVIPLIRI